MTRLKWKHVSVCLEIVLILTQDRCGVCAKRTIGSEIILDAPDGICMHPVVLLGDDAQVKAHFGLFGDSANIDAR